MIPLRILVALILPFCRDLLVLWLDQRTFSRIVDGVFPLFFVRYRILVRILRLGGGKCNGKRLGNVIRIRLRINILSL